LLAPHNTTQDKDAANRRDPEVLVRSVAERVAASSGLEFVDVEMKRGGKGPVFQIFLDKPERISLDDLENASREISAILDVEDPIRRSYTLEVSSPGMTRPLKTARDFNRVIEKNIQVSFADAAEKSGVREIKGRLVAVTENEVRLIPRDNKGREGAEIAVPFAALRHAQREISFR
jgi:ribosome maturation factor RimP